MIYLGLYLIGAAAFVHALILYYSDVIKTKIFTYLLLKNNIDIEEKLKEFQNNHKHKKRNHTMYIMILIWYGITWPWVLIKVLYNYIVLLIKEKILNKKIKKYLKNKDMNFDVKIVNIMQLKDISFKELLSLKLNLNLEDLQKEEEIQVENKENKD